MAHLPLPLPMKAIGIEPAAVTAIEMIMGMSLFLNFCVTQFCRNTENASDAM